MNNVDKPKGSLMAYFTIIITIIVIDIESFVGI